MTFLKWSRRLLIGSIAVYLVALVIGLSGLSPEAALAIGGYAAVFIGAAALSCLIAQASLFFRSGKLGR